MKEIRIHEIENYIYEKGTVSLTDLAEEFDVSIRMPSDEYVQNCKDYNVDILVP